MRGKVPQIQKESEVKGITPAYAGKSLTLASVTISREDHPRLCGEKLAKVAVQFLG